MKKHWLVILAVMLVASAFAQRYEVVAYQEDFESGENGWTHYDGAVSPNDWHVFDYGGPQGNAWWMGDPSLASGGNIGGYYNHQYLVLDTPARTLTAANATLTFKMRLGLEDPGASGGYDGWDSANVRISTNGGTTWSVLTNPTPTYDFANSYAFGFEHGEGMGIPGWGGIVTNWTPVTFNLAAYIGQSVMIRFAFASDPAYSTAQQANMFGFMVDDIAFGGYTNNGVDDGQMVSSSLVPLGGDYWHIATDPTAPSPSHVMKNQNAQGSYSNNMLNYLVSPSITLPSSGEIWCDFQIMGSFSAAGTFPDVDYWGWEISPDNGTVWNAMSNPYGLATGTNYVYSDAPTVWASMIQSYSLDGVISDYAGQTVKFRWYFKSNATITEGPGIMIDDFKIFNDVFVAPPENLVATVNGSDVTLNWDAPGSGGGGGEEGWLHYDGDPSNNSVGTDGASDFDVAAKWNAMGETNSIYPYVGMNITKIQFIPAEANCEYSVRVWTGATNALVVDQLVSNPILNGWNEIVLDTPFTIPAGTQIMAGYRCNTQAGFPAGADAGPAIDGFGNMIRLGGWSTLLTLAPTLDYNWNIRVYVADADGREYVLGELPQNDTVMNGSLSAHTLRTTRTSAYRIYRDGIMIDEVGPTVLTYVDNNVAGGTHNYYVTAMYDANESPASNIATVFVMPSTTTEGLHDDGTAEQGLTVGSSRQMAVLHDQFAGPVTLKFAKVYVHNVSTASIIVRAYAVAENGLPGATLVQVQYPGPNVVQGWNYIPFPDTVVPEGNFFLAILETPNASSIGVDTNNSGFSYVNMGASWTPYADGEIMIRAIVYTESVDDLYPPSNLRANAVGNDVHLAWNAPEPPPPGEWITWCNPDVLGNGIGTGGVVTFDVAHLFDHADLAPYMGSTLTHVGFVPNEVNCVYTLKVWTGGTATTPGPMVHSQVVPTPTIGAWNEVLLTTPIPVPATGNLWFGYEVNTQTGHPAGCDDGPMVPGKGNIMNFNGWTTLNQVSASLTYNWLIQGYLDHNRALVRMPDPIYEAPRAPQSGRLAMQVNPNASIASAKNYNRALIGYKLFRDGNLVATIPNPATLAYIDADLALGTYSYTLTAFYNSGESIPIGPVEVTLESLAAPADLAATVDGNDVSLSWTNPAPPQPGEWISWSNNTEIGNSIGTNAAASFDVAHRYEASDLTQHVGGALTQVKFAPMYADCIYTVKIWTGGTATAPGTLVHSQVVSNPAINDWTTAILTNPITIAAGTQYWIGYGVNTQGGHPAGCDDGPMVPGKGNIMNFQGWTTLDQLNASLTYNWLIQGFVAQGRSLKAIELPAIVEAPLPAATGQLSSHFNVQARDSRAVHMGYKVYRNGTAIAEINDPLVVTFVDNNVPNGDYIYGVSARYNTGESAPATVNVNVNLQLAPVVLEDSFETYADFATEFGHWTLIDQDNSETYGFTGITFPGSGSPMAYIIFNPSQTVPPITDVLPHTGSKMAASFAAVTPPNKDMLISRRINLGTNSSLKFYARSHTTNYGMERFRVGVSTMPIILPQGFQYITGAEDVQAPATWTEYMYDLSAYDGQDVYIAIRCTSNDAFVFYVDDFSVHTDGGTGSEDPTAPVLVTELKGNYPNPFNPETTISFSTKEAGPVALEIYNVKGQLVKKLVNEDKAAGNHTVVWNGTDLNNRPVSTGVYFYKMNAGKYSSTRKMIMMK
ncbi:MAG: choice-of-anchor J domain-containing protein [Candidatus Cloacimonadaceae bacterium]|nr:choice-of-anchor J domain-containing protein [Candidatus Cloacimonadaceae bacterium]